MAETILADFKPLQFDDIPEFVVRPAVRRDYQAQAPRYALRERVQAGRSSLKAKLSDAWRARQERVALQAIAQLAQTPAPYDAVSVMRYQAKVSLRPTLADRLSGLRAPRPARGMVLACSVMAGLLPLGWAVSAHLSAPAAPVSAPVAASSMIAGQNLQAKLPEIKGQAAGATLERGTRSADVTYVVRQGDTFTSVGEKFGLTGRTVRLVNELPLGARLRAGQKLTVPPVNGAYHRVHQGETLGHLAKRYDVTPAKLVAANPGLKADKLALNQRVFVPGATALKYRAALMGESRGYRRGPWSQRQAAARSLVGRFGARVGALSTPAFGDFSSPFGVRGASFHPGMDICNVVGTPIKAAKAGTVLTAGWNGAYGMSVDIDHGGGVVTRYAHCSKLLVRAGQSVEAGQQIAKMGSTGRSTGPHLHFEVRIQDRAVNPASFF